MAFEVVKAMEADGLEWGEDYHPFARAAVAEVIEDQMALAVDRYLEGLEAEDASDRHQWPLSAPPVDDARRHRPQSTAHSALHTDHPAIHDRHIILIRAARATRATGPSLTFWFFCGFPYGLDHASLENARKNPTQAPADRAELEAVVAKSERSAEACLAKTVLLTAEGTSEIKRRTAKAKTVIWRWQARLALKASPGYTALAHPALGCRRCRARGSVETFSKVIGQCMKRHHSFVS